eukprot:scaffold5886_cov161-Amphora_coffeaeformis.AAC.7
MVLNNLINCCLPPRYKKTQQEEQQEAAAGSAVSSDDNRGCCGVRWTAFVLSTGSDLDIATDWAYYNSLADNSKLPGWLSTLVLLACVAALVVYFLQVTEGRCVKRILRRWFGIPVTNKGIVRAGVWVEDYPQLILTLLIQVGYSGGGGGGLMSWPALLNLATSGTDAYHKSRALWKDYIHELEDDDEEAAAATTPNEQDPLLGA